MIRFFPVARRRRSVRAWSLGSIEALEARELLATVPVHIFNFDFSRNPQGGAVVDPIIFEGDTIQWVFDEGRHSTTSVAGSAETWDSGVQDAGAPNFEHTFTQAGKFNYYCVVHGGDNGNGTATGMSGTINVLAPTSVLISPSNFSVAEGNVVQFTATGTLPDGSLLDLKDLAAWTSSSTAVATIDGNGLATTIGPGQTTISAHLGSSGETTLTVVGAPALQSISINPPALTLAPGKTAQLTVTAHYSDGSTADVTSQVDWASGTRQVATVSPTGLVSALSQGETSIAAKFDGEIELVEVKVTPNFAQPNPKFTGKGVKNVARVNKLFKGIVATFKERNSSKSHFVAVVDWGDGSPVDLGKVKQTVNDEYTVSHNHKYLSKGKFTITVVITDLVKRLIITRSKITVRK